MYLLLQQWSDHGLKAGGCGYAWCRNTTCYLVAGSQGPGLTKQEPAEGAELVAPATTQQQQQQEQHHAFLHTTFGSLLAARLAGGTPAGTPFSLPASMEGAKCGWSRVSR